MITAILGSHSNFAERGFRQKDVRFLFELFANWLDARVKPESIRLHNTQVQRTLEDLVARGWARRESVTAGKAREKRYLLTRLGILEFMQSLAEPETTRDFVPFLFVYYFLRTYGSRLSDLVRAKGSGFSKPLQVEINLLLDHERLRTERVRRLDFEIERLKSRMQETEDTARTARKLSREAADLGDIVRRIARDFPYELQAQKPMTDLMQEIPPELRLWELTEGNESRVRIIWKGLLHDLEAERRLLKDLRPAP